LEEELTIHQQSERSPPCQNLSFVEPQNVQAGMNGMIFGSSAVAAVTNDGLLLA